MKIFFSILFVLFFSSVSQSQVQIQWQKCLGGTYRDNAYTIISTFDGGYAAAGYSQSNDGNVSGHHNPGFEPNNRDVWIVKLSPEGNIQWQKCFGGTLEDVAYSIIQTSDSCYLITGATKSSDGDFIINHGGFDVFVIKIDQYGNLIWYKCFGGTGDDEAYSIMKTLDGSYITSGRTFSNNGDFIGNHGGFDVFAIKFDQDGNFIWQKCYGGLFGDESSSIIPTQDSCVLIMGKTDSDSGDVSGVHGFNDGWVVKLDQEGNILWQKCVGGEGEDGVRSGLQTIDGGYVIAGWTLSSFGDVNGHIGNADFWVVKLDFDGNIEWQKCLGGSSADFSNAIISTHDNNFTLIGYTQSSNENVSGHHNPESYDIWVVKIDPEGNLIWQQCLGGSSWDYGFSIVQPYNGIYIIAGYTYSNNGDVSLNHGNYDFWITKIREPNISGKVFHDINENGYLDSLEQGIPDQILLLEPESQYTLTNNEGNFFFFTDTGNYNLLYSPYSYWYSTGVNTYNFDIDSIEQKIDTLNFGINSLIDIDDLSIVTLGTSTRVGFETHYWVSYKNYGTSTISGTVNFKYDSLLTFNSSTLIPNSHIGNILSFNYDTLGPGSERIIRIDFQVPGIENIGDTLNSNSWITPFVPDTNIANNYDTIFQIITAAYDPNNKLVTPSGFGPQGMVFHGQRLTYIINFQNTGTDTAITVFLRDTLSNNLDFGTFLLESSSHPLVMEMNAGNELKFVFSNILLPDSTVNEPESHGFVRYSISPKPGLAEGTQVTNTAYIFFDYNPAVVTNTTFNTFVSEIPVSIPEQKLTQTIAYPNPSKDFVYINLPESTSKIEVYNINGEKLIQMLPDRQVAEINISSFSMGIYLVKIYCNKGVINSKFIKD